MVEKAPCIIKKDVPLAEADTILAKFKEIGQEVEKL